MGNQSKGNFKSNFGFLMAAVGVAVGLGNIWGFPYKMGSCGGAVFLLIYVVMAVFVGYPLLLGEIALGRKTRRGAIEAYHEVDPRFTFNGVFEAVVPFLLICFYCVLGGAVIKYMIANLGDIFHASWGVHGASGGDFFGGFVGNTGSLMMYTLIFLILTVIIVLRGIQGGIETVCNIGMPILFVMLIITVIYCCTLPGSGGGLEFMFKPNLEVFRGTGWFKVFAMAASQMFFSLSIASGALIAYGSYMRESDNLEKSAIIIPILDTCAALLAGMAVFPAVFSAGLEPASGPGLLFVSLQEVFNSMGKIGPAFGFLFYLLVFVATFSSSIGMMEGGVSAAIDFFIKKGKGVMRGTVTLIMALTTLIGASLVAIDNLGGNEAVWKPFGLGSWLDVFDMGGEGILMPLGGMIMAIMLGWFRRGVLDDEILKGSNYKSRGFVTFCWKYIIPVFMAFVLFMQISTFFFSNAAWYQALMG